MQPISLKSGFLALTLVAIASITGGLILRGSSVSSQESGAPNTTAQEHGGMHDMGDGSSMDHGMAMDLGPADAEYDLRFMDAMTPHHQGGVEMAKLALQKSKRPEIKQLAKKIIKDQNNEIAQMKQWRQAWYPKASAELVAYDSKMGHSMPMSSEQATSMTMNQNLGPADADFDLRFIKGMTPHHQGAVTMAKDALSKSKRPEIKQLAQKIATSQQAEIEQLKQWQQAWYKK